MCLQRPSYDIMKHFNIKLKYLLKLNERLVESFFDHSDLLSEQEYIIEMKKLKECQENWNRVKGVCDIYKHMPTPTTLGNSWFGMDYLEGDIALAEMTQFVLIERIRYKKKKQLK